MILQIEGIVGEDVAETFHAVGERLAHLGRGEFAGADLGIQDHRGVVQVVHVLDEDLRRDELHDETCFGQVLVNGFTGGFAVAEAARVLFQQLRAVERAMATEEPLLGLFQAEQHFRASLDHLELLPEPTERREELDLPAADAGDPVRTVDAAEQELQPVRAVHDRVGVERQHEWRVDLGQGQVHGSGVHQRRRHAGDIVGGAFDQPDPGERPQIVQRLVPGGVVDRDHTDGVMRRVFADGPQTQTCQLRGLVIRQDDGNRLVHGIKKRQLVTNRINFLKRLTCSDDLTQF